MLALCYVADEVDGYHYGTTSHNPFVNNLTEGDLISY